MALIIAGKFQFVKKFLSPTLRKDPVCAKIELL